MRSALVLLIVAVALAGCGKKGSPSAPGPKDEIIFPKTYPKPN